LNDAQQGGKRENQFEMKAIKLTPKERELFEELKSHEGGVLRQHIKPSNAVCFRLLDKEFNPVKNYRYGIVHQLIDKNVLELVGHDYTLKATSGN
jgi:hypothetical protein